MRAYGGVHMTAEYPKGKEQPLNLDGINGRVAFFLHHLAKDPKRYLKPDEDLGGYTSLGVINHTPELFDALTPVLERVKKDKEIRRMADQYWNEILDYDKQGTLCYSLYKENRQAFLDFLEKNKCTLTERQKKTISTEMFV